MPEILNLLASHLAEQPDPAVEQIHSSVCFIIDQKRQPQALESIYQQGGAFTCEFLLAATEFSHLARSGPLWVNARRGSGQERIGLAACLENAGGIVIHSHDPDAALKHARWLLKVNDGSGGQSLATYYLPELWAAMVLYCDSPVLRGHLFGPWQSVSSAAPRYMLHSQDWLHWLAPASDSADKPKGYFTLPEQTPQAYRTLRWLYWLERHHERFSHADSTQLPLIIANLNYLRDCGITQSRHLLKLAGLIEGPAIEEQPELSAIATTGDAPYLLVERLLAVAQ